MWCVRQNALYSLETPPPPFRCAQGRLLPEGNVFSLSGLQLADLKTLNCEKLHCMPCHATYNLILSGYSCNDQRGRYDEAGVVRDFCACLAPEFTVY